MMRLRFPIALTFAAVVVGGCPRENVNLGTPHDGGGEDAVGSIDAEPPPADAAFLPRELIYVANGPLDSPWALAIDAENAYVTGAMSQGRVLQIPLDGNGVVQIASTPGGSFWVEVDQSDIYWLELQGVMKAPIGGGTVTTLAAPPVTGSNALALDDISVYYTTRDGNVERVAKGGGAITVLATNQDNASGITTDGVTIWWANFADDGAIMSVPEEGGTPALFKMVPFVRDGLTVRGPNIQYMSEASGAAYVGRMPSAGGSETTLASWSTTGRAGNIAVDQTHAWFWQPDCAIGKAALDGSGVEVRSYPGLGCPRFFAVDDTYLYFTTELGLARVPK